MDKNQSEQLQRLAKLLNIDKVISATDIENIFQGIVSILANNKKEIASITPEIKSIAEEVFNQMKVETEKTFSEIDGFKEKVTEELKKEAKQKIQDIKDSGFESMISEATDLLNKVRAIKVTPAKDGISPKISDIVVEVLKNLPDTKPVAIDSPIMIATKLEKLTGTDRLKYTAIEGLEEYVTTRVSQQQPFPQGGRIGGGVTQIKAGTNVTITSTGANGRGVVTINATGGTSSPLTTKGDLYVFSTINDRLPVGSNGKVLSADSTAATGLKWITLGGGGDMTIATYDPAGIGEQLVGLTATQTLSNKILTSATVTTKLSPTTDDGAPLGDTTHNFSDLFLASGAVINFNNGDVTLTHSADTLTLAGGSLIANDISLTSGSALRTRLLAGNTMLIQARDVDGAAYTTFITLTANNTPTCDLSTAVTVGGALISTGGGTATGTNTGDQTSVTGNAGTATALATGRTISISGDLTYTSPSFDGTGNVTAAGTLATVNSNVGSFGSATKSVTLTVNGKGLVTAASESTITPAVGAITGLGTGVATALAVNVGSAGAFVVLGGALGTPSSGTGTNITGIPAANILAGSFGAGAYVISTSLQVATLELGAATDTTLSRVSAGVIAVEGVTILTTATGQPLDSDLTTIAGLTATTNNFMVSASSAWSSMTPTNATALLIAMVGDSGSGGTKGLVPAPASGDAAASKFLKADGTWAVPAGGSSGITIGSTTITSGANTRILYNNSGVVGEYTLTGTGTVVMMGTSPTVTTSLIMADAANIVINATTGTKFGTATTQKLSFYNSTPIVQPTGDVITALQNLGLVASATVLATTITSRTLWGQTYDGSGNVTGSLTAVGDITGGANNMTITAGTGNSRTLTLRTTTVGGSATAALTLGSDQSTTFGGTAILGAASITMTGSIAATGARVTKGWFTDLESTNMPTVGGTVILTSLTAPQFTTIELGAASDTTLARVAAGIGSIEGETINGYATTATAAGTTTLTITAAKIQYFTGSSTQTVKLPTTSVVVGQTYTITNTSTGLVTVQSSGANTIATLGLNQTAIFTAVAATPTTAANWSYAKSNLAGNTNGKRILVVTQSATPSMDTDNGDVMQMTALAQAITSMTTNLTGTPNDGDKIEIQITDNGTARAIAWGTSFANGGVVLLPLTTVVSVMLRVLLQYQTTASLNKWVCIAVA